MTIFEITFRQYQWTALTYPTSDGVLYLKKGLLIPNQYGVYVIRASKLLNRVQGSSDVIYIGQSGGTERRGKQGIRDRIFNTRSVEELIRERIEGLSPNQNFTLQYFLTGQLHGEAAKQLEEQLLTAYLQSHYELPPANHQCPSGFTF